MPIAIVGAGITGSTLARCLAEKGHTVHVYEASTRYGGQAYVHRYRCKVRQKGVRQFLFDRCGMQEIGDGLYYPEESWHRACQGLLDHQNISPLYAAPVIAPHLLRESYQMAFSTVRADRLYGQDVTTKGLFPDAARVLFHQYKKAAYQQGIVLVGQQDMYQIFTIEESILRVLHLAQQF